MPNNNKAYSALMYSILLTAPTVGFFMFCSSGCLNMFGTRRVISGVIRDSLFARSTLYGVWYICWELHPSE